MYHLFCPCSSPFRDGAAEAEGCAPWLPALLTREGVREDIEYLLAEGRARNCSDTCQLLKSVRDREIRQRGGV